MENLPKSKFKIAKDVLCIYLIKKKPFTLESISKEILDNDGLLRISPDLTLKESLDDLVYHGVLTYNNSRRIYKTNKAY